MVERKGKEEYLYSVMYIFAYSLKALMHWSQFNLQIHHACFSFVIVHQMAPPLTKVADIVAHYYSSIDPEGMKGWVGLQKRTFYPHKSSPVRLSATGLALVAQDRESSPAKDRHSTAVPGNQPRNVFQTSDWLTVNNEDSLMNSESEESPRTRDRSHYEWTYRSIAFVDDLSPT